MLARLAWPAAGCASRGRRVRRQNHWAHIQSMTCINGFETRSLEATLPGKSTLQHSS